MNDKRIARLVKQAQHGNKEAFARLIAEKARKILFFATSLMEDPAEGEDLAQESLITIGKNISKLKDPASLDAWIYRIIFNMCMDAKKGRAKTMSSDDGFEYVSDQLADDDIEASPEQWVTRQADNALVWEAIERLPEHYRACLVLYYYEDMSFEEIADVLGVSYSAVNNYISRARTKLKADLEESNPTLVRYGALEAGALTAVMSQAEQASVTDQAIHALEVTAGTTALTAKGVLAGLAGSWGVRAASLGALAVVGSLIAVMVTAPEGSPGHEAPQDVQQPAAEDPADPDTSATIVYTSDGSQVFIAMRGDAEWESLEPQITSMEHVKQDMVDGFSYDVFQDASGNYYLIFDEVEGEVPDPRYLDITI